MLAIARWQGEAGDLPFLDTDGGVVIGQQRVVRLAHAAGEAELRLGEGFRAPNGCLMFNIWRVLKFDD
jgi:hypothetical protein